MNLKEAVKAIDDYPPIRGTFWGDAIFKLHSFAKSSVDVRFCTTCGYVSYVSCDNLVDCPHGHGSLVSGRLGKDE